MSEEEKVEPTIHETKEHCPLCDNDWTAIWEVAPECDPPVDGQATMFGGICRSCKEEVRRQAEEQRGRSGKLS